MANKTEKWDKWFLGLAEYVSTASKDPSTKVGAVVVDQLNRVVSVGYNGFPRGVDDAAERYADRDLKNKLIVHAEINAMVFAQRNLSGCTLYTWPFGCCSRCAAQVIQHGIRRVVSPVIPDGIKERWGDDVALAAMSFSEAGVKVVEYGKGRKACRAIWPWSWLMNRICGRP